MPPTSEEFLDYLRTEFPALSELGSLGLESRLLHDLEFDSLEILRLVVVIESLGGNVPEDLDLSIASLGDLYYYFSLGSREPKDS